MSITTSGGPGSSVNVVPPTLDVETQLFSDGYPWIGSLDEVGTGSAVGPCHCAIVVIGPSCGPFPPRLRDSKLLSAPARESLVPEIERWVSDYAIGSASAQEIDQFGLTAALGFAGRRALAQLSVVPSIVLLDGQRDWLTDKRPSLAGADLTAVRVPRVITRVKADRHCASVAAASVLAKVRRDALLSELAMQYPGYGWERNKGYVTAAHRDAIIRLGLTPEHRRSWNLLG